MNKPKFYALLLAAIGLSKLPNDGASALKPKVQPHLGDMQLDGDKYACAVPGEWLREFRAEYQEVCRLRGTFAFHIVPTDSSLVILEVDRRHEPLLNDAVQRVMRKIEGRARPKTYLLTEAQFLAVVTALRLCDNVVSTTPSGSPVRDSAADALDNAVQVVRAVKKDQS